jgi:hypothetical protein
MYRVLLAQEKPTSSCQTSCKFDGRRCHWIIKCLVESWIEIEQRWARCSTYNPPHGISLNRKIAEVGIPWAPPLNVKNHVIVSTMVSVTAPCIGIPWLSTIVHSGYDLYRWVLLSISSLHIQDTSQLRTPVVVHVLNRAVPLYIYFITKEWIF